MSEWKVGEIGYIRAAFLCHYANNGERNLKFMISDGTMVYVRPCDLLRSIPPSPPAPVDVLAIRVGDEVTVMGVVMDTDDDEPRIEVGFKNNDVWVYSSEILSHTPRPRPTTFAEFNAMTAKQQERWFAEVMTKGKVG